MGSLLRDLTGDQLDVLVGEADRELGRPDVQRAANHKSRTRKTGAGGSFTADEWRALCTQYDYRCLACGERKPLTVDHVMPVSLGGTSDITNIQPLCLSCNRHKHADILDYRGTTA